jgi:hypothetical protein
MIHVIHINKSLIVKDRLLAVQEGEFNYDGHPLDLTSSSSTEGCVYLVIITKDNLVYIQ